MSNPYAQQGGNGWGNNPQGQQGYGQGPYGAQPQQQGYGAGQYGAQPQQQSYGQNASNPYGVSNSQNPTAAEPHRTLRQLRTRRIPTVARVATPTARRTRAATRRVTDSRYVSDGRSPAGREVQGSPPDWHRRGHRRPRDDRRPRRVGHAPPQLDQRLGPVLGSDLVLVGRPQIPVLDRRMETGVRAPPTDRGVPPDHTPRIFRMVFMSKPQILKWDRFPPMGKRPLLQRL